MLGSNNEESKVLPECVTHIFYPISLTCTATKLCSSRFLPIFHDSTIFFLKEPDNPDVERPCLQSIPPMPSVMAFIAYQLYTILFYQLTIQPTVWHAWILFSSYFKHLLYILLTVYFTATKLTSSSIFKEFPVEAKWEWPEHVRTHIKFPSSQP